MAKVGKINPSLSALLLFIVCFSNSALAVALSKEHAAALCPCKAPACALSLKSVGGFDCFSHLQKQA